MELDLKFLLHHFTFWTPDVYEGAPIAITAYLSVASKAAGFALLDQIYQSYISIQSTAPDGSWIIARHN